MGYLMRKILAGIVASIIAVAAAGYYGATLWAQYQLKNEVEATFEALRATVGTATHGGIEFDLWRRQITIADIVLQSDQAATVTMKIGGIVAAGVTEPAPGRIATDRIDITDLELIVSSLSSSSPQMIHKASKITILGYSGPVAPLSKIEAPTIVDVLRLSLEYFAATTATSISIPTLSATIASLPWSNTGSGMSGPIDYTYSNIALHDIRDGHIGLMSMGRLIVTGDADAPGFGKFTGEIGGFSAVDFDTNVLLTVLNPSKVRNDGYLRLYQRVTFGPYSIRFDKGTRVRMDSLALEDIGLRPSKLALAEVFALANAEAILRKPASPAQMRAMLDKIAGLYEGIRIGKIELRGVDANMPPEFALKLTAIKLSGLENGRLAEFSLEGLDSQTPQNMPVTIGHFVLKGLNLARLVRMSAQLSAVSRTSEPEQLLGLLALIEGIEVKDAIASNGAKKKPVRIDVFRLSWGHFVGPIPSTARITANATVPTNLATTLSTILAINRSTFQILADTGLQVADVNLDLGVSWTETTRTFVVTPLLVELGEMFSASGTLSIHNESARA